MKGSTETLPSGRVRARKIDPKTGRYRKVGTFDTQAEADHALAEHGLPTEQEVAEMLRREIPTWWTRFEDTANQGTHGLVYLLLAEDSCRVKFGFTRDRALFEKRLTRIRSLSASDVTPLVVVKGSLDMELDIHAALEPHRHHGEWYELTPEVMFVVAALMLALPEVRA